jgi:hypothetical protein
VIEHLTRVDEQVPGMLQLLKPGGWLIAQGPLEANACLFTAVLRLARLLRGSPPASIPPYHVLLATVASQRALFRRFALEEVEYSIREVDWPAPTTLARRDLLRPRAVGLWTLRRVSRACSRLRPGTWGNRYFYAGRYHPEMAHADR